MGGLKTYENQQARDVPFYRAFRADRSNLGPLFPFLKETILQTENVYVSVCPTNQKLAFLNQRQTADFPCENYEVT